MIAKGVTHMPIYRLKDVHPSVTASRVMELTEAEMTTLDNPGICLACGETADGCEPDAERYECEHCGEHHVYGAAQLLISGMYWSDKP
jgi:hypothetical protein